MEFFVNLGIERLGFNLEEVEGCHLVSSAMGCERLVEDFFNLAHAVHIDQGNRLRIREFERVYRLIAEVAPQLGDDFHNFNEQIRPFGIISVDYRGNISTFSPELMGQTSTRYSDFLFSNVNQGGISAVLENSAFRSAFSAIHEGVSSCAKECEFFNYCGGGAPVNKFFEKGTFAATETFFCRAHLKIPFSVVLNALEAA